MVSHASGQAIGSGIGRRARRKVWRVRRWGSAGAATAITAATSESPAVATSEPAAPMECPSSAARVTSGRPRIAATPACASAAYSPTDIGSSSGPLAP